MSPMDHAAAHERIEDLLLEPSRLAALESSEAPQDGALREHVAGCPACRADLAGSRRLQRTIAAALPASSEAASAAVDPVELPPSLRATVIAAARSDARAGGRNAEARAIHIAAARGATRPRPGLAPFIGLAALLVVLVGSAAITLDQVNRRSAAEADARAVSTALAAVDRVLAEPAHRMVALRTPTGGTAGTIAWSRHDWVVLATALAAPAPNTEYLCWLEEDGRSVRVGAMDFAGSTAYWVASLDEWQTWEIGPTTRFVVSLEAPGAQSRTGSALLSADLGG